MMNQKIKWMALICSVVFLLRGSDDEVSLRFTEDSEVFLSPGSEQKITYNLRFEADADWIVITQDEYNLMPTIKNMVADTGIDISKGKIDISYKSTDEYMKHSLFTNMIRPVIKQYLILNNHLTRSDKSYRITINLISKIESTTYEQFKNAFLLSGYLGLPLEISRAFGNLCYDMQEKREVDTLLTIEQQ